MSEARGSPAVAERVRERQKCDEGRGFHRDRDGQTNPCLDNPREEKTSHVWLPAVVCSRLTAPLAGEGRRSM